MNKKETKTSKELTSEEIIERPLCDELYYNKALNWKKCAESYANMLVESHKQLLLKCNKLELFADIESKKLLNYFNQCNLNNPLD